MITCPRRLSEENCLQPRSALSFGQWGGGGGRSERPPGPPIPGSATEHMHDPQLECASKLLSLYLQCLISKIIQRKFHTSPNHQTYRLIAVFHSWRANITNEKGSSEATPLQYFAACQGGCFKWQKGVWLSHLAPTPTTDVKISFVYTQILAVFLSKWMVMLCLNYDDLV